MTTTLSRFSDAYATLTVAQYEPLILRWVSGISINDLATTFAWRRASTGKIDLDRHRATVERAMAVKLERHLPDPNESAVDLAPTRGRSDTAGAG
jgi:DNA-directed RNA polymerase specialized sigma24 family protein